MSTAAFNGLYSRACFGCRRMLGKRKLLFSIFLIPERHRLRRKPTHAVPLHRLLGETLLACATSGAAWTDHECSATGFLNCSPRPRFCPSLSQFDPALIRHWRGPRLSPNSKQALLNFLTPFPRAQPFAPFLSVRSPYKLDPDNFMFLVFLSHFLLVRLMKPELAVSLFYKSEAWCCFRCLSLFCLRVAERFLSPS